MNFQAIFVFSRVSSSVPKADGLIVGVWYVCVEVQRVSPTCGLTAVLEEMEGEGLLCLHVVLNQFSKGKHAAGEVFLRYF